LRPRIAIGLPLYESVEFMPAALASLLGQTRRDFALVVVDDSRSDEPHSILAVRSDERVHYERNATRLGLAANWRHAFERAVELHPGCVYFAWASDHDVWEPNWLERLAQELDHHPDAVLAYGSSSDGWRFDTRDDRSRARRFARTLRRMVAGDMVYGLYRREALERTGGFRRLLLPDRLLLAELSLQGSFRQVDELLWHRRRAAGSDYSVARQLAAIFPTGARLRTRAPWWLTHAGAIAWSLGFQGRGRPAVGRRTGFAAAAAYGLLAPGYAVARTAHRTLVRRD
jgi:glycosyltransferase involved in cell wall biosynthesis